MTRLASMIVPLLAAAALTAGVARAGEYYERVGPNHYKPSDGAWYSSTCCYKKIIKHITITKEVWVKVPPPKAPRPHYHRPLADDELIEAPRPAPHPYRHPPVVELGEVFRQDGQCLKAVPARSRGLTVIVLVNVHCR